MGFFKKSIIKKMVLGRRAIDGADVELIRLLSANTIYDFDPFLMLDTFDSTDPSKYKQGFPLHPHRGIESITYLIEGSIDHRDTLGNAGCISAGEAQWMTAGSGVMHEEIPRLVPRMLGFQLWLNLPEADKMTEPSYRAITKEQIPVVKKDFGCVHVVAGQYDDARGTQAQYVSATLLDIALSVGKCFELEMNPSETAFIFLIEGDALLDNRVVPEKTAVLLDTTQKLAVRTQSAQDLRLFYYAAKPLREPIAWGGPIIMNTQKELYEAITDVEQGTFVRA
jgi:redox-sensitive bicupin YhaK (pirin superfamily)